MKLSGAKKNDVVLLSNNLRAKVTVTGFSTFEIDWNHNRYFYSGKADVRNEHEDVSVIKILSREKYPEEYL